ncbi:MAG TPA: dihydroxyacetone kinase subunit DhaL [Mycobacteriales bacterium]|nr:dihydroxyacetone kinase subunit DhaL [Mycobacteriales bacterium]
MPVDAELARSWVTGFADSVTAAKDELTKLDQAIGDGDHGSNMSRGLTQAVAKLAGDTPGDVLKGVGRTLISTVGGASGPLYGTAFREAGKALGDAASADDTAFAAALRAGMDGIIRLGKAETGDKTMIDAWTPALAALDAALAGGSSLADATAAAAAAAADGAEATIPLQARKGRASYLGPRSVGHQDPGATSTTMLFATLAKAAG